MAYAESAAMSNRCPHCGQLWPSQRFGVHMYPQTAKIFDLIRGAGRAGIDSHAIMARAYAGVRRPRWSTAAAHITHARNSLAETYYRIVCEKHGSRPGVYRLVKVVKVSAFG